MASKSPALHRSEVIDLVSDDSDGSHATLTPTGGMGTFGLNDDDFFNLADDLPFFDTTPGPLPRSRPSISGNGNRRDTLLGDDDDGVLIPDEVDLPRVAHPRQAEAQDDRDPAPATGNHLCTVEQCLHRVLEIFPDIKHDHVRELYNAFDTNSDYEILPGPARLDNIVEQLVSAVSYPKQEKSIQAPQKRKREDTDEDIDSTQWERHDREIVPRAFQGCMRAMLKAEFPEIPQQFIQTTLSTHKHLFQAYIALATTKDLYDPANPPYGRGRALRNHLADATTIATGSGFPALLDELKAAQQRAAVLRDRRVAELAERLAEQDNLELAKERGETAECSACFDDLPINRMIQCGGATIHFTCYECALTYIKSEVGESRCNVLCPAGCGSAFAYRELQLLSDKQLLQKLAELEQEKAIRDAGLEDLEECPFCDYKAILPPVEQDFEFRCANPECERVSCRRCKSVSHIPLSCEQHAKETNINSRHKIEEAMTAALVRACNKCKKQFIKDYGCNKMTCPSCRNLQCYVCSATIKDYTHFDDRGPGRAAEIQATKMCPLYDNSEERHEREVKEAEAAARAQVIAENPDIDANDLEIKVSDAVKKTTDERIRRAGGGGLPPHVAALMAGPPYVPPMPHRPVDYLDDLGRDVIGAGEAMLARLRRGGPPRAPAPLPPDNRPGALPPMPPQAHNWLPEVAIPGLGFMPGPRAPIPRAPVPRLAANGNIHNHLPGPVPPVAAAQEPFNHLAHLMGFGDDEAADFLADANPADNANRFVGQLRAPAPAVMGAPPTAQRPPQHRNAVGPAPFDDAEYERLLRLQRDRQALARRQRRQLFELMEMQDEDEDEYEDEDEDEDEREDEHEHEDENEHWRDFYEIKYE